MDMLEKGYVDDEKGGANVINSTFSKDDAIKYFQEAQLYTAAIKEIKTKLEILDDEFRVKFDYNPIHHIESRLKSPHSIIEKLKRKNLPVNISSMKSNIYDIAGIRVICNHINDIEDVAALLIRQDDIRLIERKDYIKFPKESGYRGLHIIISVPIFLSDRTVNVPIEIQLRTIAMDFWASLEHRMKYKFDGEITPDISLRMKRCSEAIYKIDEEMQMINEELKKNNGEK